MLKKFKFGKQTSIYIVLTRLNLENAMCHFEPETTEINIVHTFRSNREYYPEISFYCSAQPRLPSLQIPAPQN